MQHTSLQFKTAIAQPSRTLRSRVTFTSTDYTFDDSVVKSITLTDALTFDRDFEIGVAPMAKVNIELVWDGDIPLAYDFEGLECDVELGVVLPDATVEYLSIGKFTVESALSKNNMLTLIASDRMHKAGVDYVSDLSYPAQLLDILQSACDQAGLVLATTTFANSNYIVPNEPVFGKVSCRTIFAQIAELAGGYAVINRKGELEIITLGDTVTRAITKDHYIDFNRDDVANSQIDTVVVIVGSEQATAGTGENPYSIVDNIFVQNPNSVVSAVYNVLTGLSYVSGSYTWQGDFSLDLGDMVTIDGYPTYILDRSLKYTGGLRETDKALAVSNVIKRSTGLGSLTLDMENAKTEIKVLDGKLELKVGNDVIVSSINQSVEGIQINSNLVSIGMGTTFENAVNYTWEHYLGKTWQQVIDSLIT